MAPITQLLHIPVDHIIERQDSLRGLDPENVEYKLLRDSVDKEGVLNPINVVPAYMPDGTTPKTHPDSGEPVYGLVDGLQRLSASRDLGFERVPAQVLNKADAEVQIVQLMANANRVQMKPRQYTDHLCRILSANPTMTKVELAERLCVQTQFIEKRLSLGNIDPEIGKKVDSGEIVLQNAYELAKLKPEDQAEFAASAEGDDHQTFRVAVQKKIKADRDARRAGRDPDAKPEFVLVPSVRNRGELVSAYETPEQIEAYITAAGLQDNGVAAAQAILAWTLQVDADSAETKKAAWEARQAKAGQEKLARQKERADKRAAELATKVAEQG